MKIKRKMKIGKQSKTKEILRQMKTRASTKEATQFQDTLWGQGEDKQVAY